MEDEYLDYIKNMHIKRVAIMNGHGWLESFRKIEDAVSYVSAITERNNVPSTAPDRLSAKVELSTGESEQCTYGSGDLIIQWLRRFA